MFMNFGRPAPVPTKTASKPSFSIRSLSLRVRPTTKLVLTSTPMASSVSISSSTMRLGSRNSGMPYIMTPPGLWNASKIVTAWPSRRTSAATVMLAGPLPITATCCPVAGLTAGGSGLRCSRSQSATKRSIRPMDTALSTSLSALPTVHVELALRLLRADAPADGGQQAVALDDGDGAARSRRSPRRPTKAGMSMPHRAALDAGRVLALQAAHGLDARLLGRVAQRHLAHVAHARRRVLRWHLLRRDGHAVLAA